MPEYPSTLQHGSGATLTLEPGLAVVTVRPEVPGPAADADAQDVDSLLSSIGLEPIADGAASANAGDASPNAGDASPNAGAAPPTAGGAGARLPMTRINNSDTLRWVRVPQDLPTAAASVADQLGDRAEWLGAVYRFPGVEGAEGLVCPLPNVLLVRPVEGADEGLAERLAGYGLTEDESRSQYTEPYRYFVLNDPLARTAYELRDVLLAEAADVVADARLETMPMLTPTTLSPNDTLFAQQWGVQRIDAPSAWDITTGDSSTIVAVLDEGCDLTHPDLRFSEPGVNLGTMLPDGSPTGNHGTACAGIAAAALDNSTGVAGVAGASPVLPLAFQNWTDAECAAGLRYAADHGASVVSMSFGVYGPGEGRGPTGWDFTVIDPAIQYAHDHNVVLCAATGNEDINTFNRYPSRHPLVIACGASSEDDNRKSSASPDGENWWGSNFAPGVSVVAPGVHISTTDRQGSVGYTTGDYVETFNGTSSATPHVAGLAALLRSFDPSLSATGVRDLIERSADKVGTVPYGDVANFPNGTRNDEMGYGRVNAAKALQLADSSQVVRAKDIALVRQNAGWSSIPVAFSVGDGTWQVTNGPAPTFIGTWANTPGVKVVTGDFNGNGLTDIALVRQNAGWASIPVAFSQGDGTWQITNGSAPTFIGSWANTAGVKVVTGDFNGNGLTDIALVRQNAGWASIPVAFSQGDGTWQITNGSAPTFIGSWANTAGVKVVTGDFNGNGLTDIALVRQNAGWASIPVAFAQGDGTWQITNGSAPTFIGSWANTPGVRVVTGDFNGNGLTDIALVRQNAGWASIPVAFAQGDGTWQITNGSAPTFIGSWANTPGVRVVTGDFNGNGLTDIALVRQNAGWSSIPVAFAQGDGTWQITNGSAPTFIGSWANTPGVRVVTGDFNDNGLTDIALVRQTPGWSSIPVAFSQGDGTWQITNGSAPTFIGSWANTAGVRLASGDFR